jgi:hypothetical protein
MTVTKEQRERELSEKKLYEEATRKAIGRDLFKAEDILTSASKIHVAVCPEFEASFKFSRLNYEETKIINRETKDLDAVDRSPKIIAAMIEKANPDLKGTVEATLKKLTPEQFAILTKRMELAAPPTRFLQPPSGTTSSRQTPPRT